MFVLCDYWRDSFSISVCSDEESDDEDDDEAELQAELAKIKEEREAAAARKLLEEQELEARLNRENAMRNNPLALIEENSAKVIVNYLTDYPLQK